MSDLRKFPLELRNFLLLDQQVFLIISIVLKFFNLFLYLLHVLPIGHHEILLFFIKSFLKREVHELDHVIELIGDILDFLLVVDVQVLQLL